ncbi:MAG: BON domain-containing protein [Gammaproteobacteria bacterium]|nr:BON domain-containing protein [Gammaproteobacteria bacterium]
MKLSTIMITLATSAMLSTHVIAKNTMDRHENNHTSTKMTAESSQPGTDVWITTKVKAALTGENLFGTYKPPVMIEVTTNKGVVNLSGNVTSKQKTDLMNYINASNGIKSIEGVKDVITTGINVN